MIDTRCGLSCENCSYKKPCNCLGCVVTNGNPFHGKCPVAECCQNKGFAYCGECPELPCSLLTDYSCDNEHGDKPKGARITKCEFLSLVGDYARVFVRGIDDLSKLKYSDGLVFDNGLPCCNGDGDPIIGFNFNDYFEKLKIWGVDIENYFKDFTPLEIDKDKNLYLHVDGCGKFTANSLINGEYTNYCGLSASDKTIFNLSCFTQTIKYMRKCEYDKGQTQDEITVYLVNVIENISLCQREKFREILKSLNDLNCRIIVVSQ